jgi:hypothetical protein
MITTEGETFESMTSRPPAGREPSSSCEFCHSTDFGVVEATYLVA